MGDRNTIAVSAAPTIEYWALLEHFVEEGKIPIFDQIGTVGFSSVASTFLDPSVMTPVKEQPLTERNPGFWTPSGVNRDKKLQDLVDRHIPLGVAWFEAGVNDWIKSKTVTKQRGAEMIAMSKRFKEIVRFALVDLTKDPRKPLFAGNTEMRPGAKQDLGTEQVFGASLVKIAAMLGAYQLLYDLNVLAKQRKVSLAAGDPKAAETARQDLFRAAWEGWVLTQPDKPAPAKAGASPDLEVQGRLVMAKGKKVPLAYAPASAHPWRWKKTDFWTWNNKRTWKRKAGKKEFEFIDGAPNLANIFDVVPGNPLTVQFKMGNNPVADGFKMGEFGNPDGHSFYERLFAMIDASNNKAAGSCILDVGYLYITSALMRTGLFSIPRGGGLFLAGTYTKGDWPTWIQDPLPVAPGGPFQVATPAAAASLMTLLAQGKLVSPAASREMLFLLNKKKSAVDPKFFDTRTNSPVLTDLRSLKREPAFAFSKLGLGPGNELSDCALIERVESKTPLRYIICFVDLLPKQAFLTQILDLVLDNAIMENAGLPVGY
jgi:hypothetical protein